MFRSLPADDPQGTKTNQFFVFFVVQAQLQRPDTCPQRDHFNGLKGRNFIVALL